MEIWIITEICCDEYVSAWRTEAAAMAEKERLNTAYAAKYGRENYSVHSDELQD